MSGQVQPEYPEEYWARYLFYAKADLMAAEKELQPPTYWHEACFLARECAEKSLKGFLEAAGKEAPTVHGLTTLLRECTASDKEFGRFRHHCQRLSRYQDIARYPPIDDEYTFTEAEACEAVHLARELYATVCAKVANRRQRQDAGGRREDTFGSVGSPSG
jgi:HEPN domain-containing protein